MTEPQPRLGADQDENPAAISPVPVGSGGEPQSAEDADEITGMVEEPAKVMRIGTMVKQLLEEVRAAPLDERGRERLRGIHERSIAELADGLSPELQDELKRLSLPFAEGIPSEAELRVAQAQLVGWLEGLFHGIQTAMVARQMAAQQRAEARARALPRGAGGQGGGGPVIVGPGGQIIGRLPMGAGGPGEDGESGPSHGTGQYL
jgi:hypothetical protein